MKKFLVLVNGLPGAGKSTTTAAISEGLTSSVVISSNSKRKSGSYKNLLSDSQRDTLLSVIIDDLSGSSYEQYDVVIVDTNLFDRKWRNEFFTLARQQGREVIFLHIRAAIQDIFSRSEKKFESQVNYDPELLNVSDIVGFVEKRAEPISFGELSKIEAYVEINTSGDRTAKIFSRKASRASAGESDLLKIISTITDDVVVRGIDEYASARAFGREVVPGFEQSYLGMLRSRVGSVPIIVPSVRAVCFNADETEILLIRNRDTDAWGLPSGSMELGEDIQTGLRRELLEETGLQASSMELVSIHSGPRHTLQNRYGDTIERLAFCFKVFCLSARPVKTTGETIDLAYFRLTDLPNVSAAHLESIEDALSFHGSVLLK
ncbi:hypothetical protein A6U97_26375 [Agrobacterium tumefaciens]|uniref:NUDIX domain-containing protein n=1 Tax=Agrobacterium tumefaciens TaxID=358 RepID=UPI00080F7658|nr:hypothetical protein A6U97_26375 [Agrobacterium tumefaciens]